MPGETDLDTILRSLAVERRHGTFTVATTQSPVELSDAVVALIAEGEGTSVVATVEEANRRGWPIEFEAAWLTITVHSSLDAVGLTAALSRALGAAGIPCNVLAGYHHDHLLVPADKADAAVAAIEALRPPAPRPPAGASD